MKPREKDYAVYDGFGLLLNVSKAGGKVWRFRYSHPITKKRQTYTIGRFPEFSLAEAREVRDELRRMIARGVDPVTEKKNRKIEMSLKNLQTFEAIANAWFAFKRDLNCGNLHCIISNMKYTNILFLSLVSTV
ncbi:integrase arm-type DNA-binding domain-containing protein [Escherichia coli]|nr:integrase arm-type DNA-binding domain-containing protein [Escherichia coli]